MSDLPPEPGKDKPKISLTRIGLWVFVGGVGLYLIVTGLIGIIAKGG